MEASPRALFVIAACSIAGLLATVGWKAGEWYRPTTPLPLAIPTPSAYVDEPDTNNDGIPDWQGTLLGLDDARTTDTIATTTSLSSESIPTATGAVTERIVQQYLYLKSSDSFTEERGERLGQSLAENLYVRTPFTPYLVSELSTTNATTPSPHYRVDLERALAPLLSLTEPDFMVYARFIETRDPLHLTILEDHAALYKKAAKDMMRMSVPEAATTSHVETANALAYFGTVLSAMVEHHDDAIASLTLLREYNEAEKYIGTSLSLLSRYYSEDTP